jgi:hypothetical protein
MMPIRKTNKGWYWGSKGPFATKQKAIDVGRAAHASGYQEEKNMTERAVVVFASTMLHSITCAHILHLKTTSYAAHIALGEYYEQVEDLIDAWIEAYQGKYGVIEKYDDTFEQHDDALQYMVMMNDWLAATRKGLPSDTELQNIVDEIVALIDSTVYKLRRFA